MPTTIADIIQRSSIPASRKQAVIDALDSHGYAPDSLADDSFFSLTTVELVSTGITLREAKTLTLNMERERRHDLVHTPDSAIERAYECVSPVEEDGVVVGTVSRIRQDGLCVSATHVWVKDGRFITATAFGGQHMQLVASFPYHDIILLQGPPGPAFRLPSHPLAVGRCITLLGFPEAPRRDIPESSDPMVAQGHIVAISPTEDLMVADYHVAMPYPSGGAVCYDSLAFAGTHVGTTYRLDKTHFQRDPEDKPPETQIDRDGSCMWSASSMASSSQGPRRGKTAADDMADLTMHTHALALHASANISCKEKLPVFVPKRQIVALAIWAGVMEDVLHKQWWKLKSW